MSEQTFDWPAGSSGMATVVDLTERLDECRYARLEAIAELDRNQGYLYDGYSSVTSFLIHRCSMSHREASREVGLARSLVDMGYAAKSASVGDISLRQLEILAGAYQKHPDPYGDDEEVLVDAIRGLTVADTRRAVRLWTDAHDHGDGDEDEAPSRVFFSKTWKGRGRLDGDLDTVTADLVNTALDQLMSEIVESTPRQDLRPPPQRRAEALAEMARRFLDSPDAPTDHGNRPHLTVVANWRTLTGEEEGTAELLDGTIISAARARQLACDANVCRLLTGPAGEILDLGRSQRTASPAQWRALRVRDRHCQWWGCLRPASWCDAHHIRFWDEHDGPTDLDNLVLICRYHHTLIHRHGWKLAGTPGNLTITRPDGTHLPNAPP